MRTPDELLTQIAAGEIYCPAHNHVHDTYDHFAKCIGTYVVQQCTALMEEKREGDVDRLRKACEFVLTHRTEDTDKHSDAKIRTVVKRFKFDLCTDLESVRLMVDRNLDVIMMMTLAD